MRLGAGSGSGSAWLMAAPSSTADKSEARRFLDISHVKHINCWINDFVLISAFLAQAITRQLINTS